MKRNKRNWKTSSLAAILAAGLVFQPASAFAAEQYTGSFHVNQFGKYEVNAAVTVDSNKITALDIEGEGFGGTHADVNQMKLKSAIDGMTDKIIGLPADDIDAINAVDGVSGATVSSNAVKGAVKNALGLEDEVIENDIPGAVPEEGEYNVTISVITDVVEHSLVQTPTTNAKLTVDEDGNMRLSYRMVSGTKEEPMYILAFNGYYEDNDPSKPLSMEGVEYNTQQAGDYTVVTDVSYPLQGLAPQYYTNTRVYVPAMSNVDGLVSGIEFDHGEFSVKTFVTVFWDTLTTGTTEERSTKITADIDEKPTSPDYVVVIPDDIAMGSLSKEKDNIMDYEVQVDTKGKTGVITVTSDEGGFLYSGKNKLPFTNIFGTQTADSAASKTAVFPGQIVIYGKDAAAAKPGNYTGTVTFKIYYTPEGEPQIPVTPEPQNPQNPQLDYKNLEDGVYFVPANMVKVDKKNLSMSDNGISHTAKITVKDGKYFITLDFKAIDLSGKTGYLGGADYFETGYTEDQYGYPQGTLKNVTVDSYQLDASGNRVKDEYGTDYPDLITFPMIPEVLEDGFAPLQVYVPVMESISAGMGTQQVYLKLDWNGIKKAQSDNSAIPEDNGGQGNPVPGGSGLSGGSGLTGGGTLGNNKLLSGNNTLGGLPSGKSGGNLMGANGIKTGDSLEHAGIWTAVLAVSGLTAVLVYKKKRNKKAQ